MTELQKLREENDRLQSEINYMKVIEAVRREEIKKELLLEQAIAGQEHFARRKVEGDYYLEKIYKSGG